MRGSYAPPTSPLLFLPQDLGLTSKTNNMEVILDLVMLKADETTLPVTAHIYQDICACKPFGKSSFSVVHRAASILGLWLTGCWESSDILYAL